MVKKKKKSQNMLLDYTCRGDQSRRNHASKKAMTMAITMVIKLEYGTPQGNEVWEFGDGFEPPHLGK